MQDVPGLRRRSLRLYTTDDRRAWRAVLVALLALLGFSSILSAQTTNSVPGTLPELKASNWRLQTQTNALNPNGWFTVPGSTATNLMLIPRASDPPGSVFFRLIFP